MSWAARSRTSARRAQMTTRAPSRPSDSAVARPIPSLPPVTMATFPCRPRSTSCRSVWVVAPRAAETAFGVRSHWRKAAGGVLGGARVMPVVQCFLPVAIPGQDRLTRPHPVQLRVVHAGRRDPALAQRPGSFEHAPPHANDRRVSGAKVLLGAVQDRTHAGNDRVVLEPH